MDLSGKGSLTMTFFIFRKTFCEVAQVDDILGKKKKKSRRNFFHRRGVKDGVPFLLLPTMAHFTYAQYTVCAGTNQTCSAPKRDDNTHHGTHSISQIKSKCLEMVEKKYIICHMSLSFKVFNRLVYKVYIYI